MDIHVDRCRRKIPLEKQFSVFKTMAVATSAGKVFPISAQLVTIQ